MGSKADGRAARQQEKSERFERAKARMTEQLASFDVGPRVAQLPDDQRFTPRTRVPLSELNFPQQPRIALERSRFRAAVTWCVRKGDIQGFWSWEEPRAWSDAEWREDIKPAFDQIERLTWGEVQKQASGEGHLMHHEQFVGTLVAEAQNRWLELGLEEFDSAFRFRLGNTKRFWGFIVQGHFFAVWWERHHRLYPTSHA